MPEIPNLNIFSSNVDKRLIGKALAEIHILISRRQKIPEADFKTAFQGQKLIAINRIGKELHFTFRYKMLWL
jgi:formamidopyrimidine-DNA glycosylase